jgi:tellurite resistance protein TerC
VENLHGFPNGSSPLCGVMANAWMRTQVMQNLFLFPFSDYWWFYGLFTLFVLGMLALDLGVFHKSAHEVSVKEAAGWSVAWISLAMIFCFGFWHYVQWKLPHYPPFLAALDAKGITDTATIAAEASRLANQTALEFLTGFVVEKSLSVDNIFVFIVVFSYFGVPKMYQHRVLFFGILGALVFRTVFITIGAALVQFQWVLWIFGGFLIFTGIKIFFADEKPIEPEKNLFIRMLRKVLPITPAMEGQKFFLRREGVLYGTPLLVCVVFIELTDIVFAVDSVPAIFAITREPLVVFTSNIFAILGLRALFFLLISVMHKFHFLKYGLGVILVFVGLKMVWLSSLFEDHKFPVVWSLGIIGGVLVASVVLSLVFPKANEEIDSPV